MDRWVIFNFYDGEFIRRNDTVIVFETKGLASQFLKRYRKPEPLQITKNFTVNYSYYDAPFRFVKEEDYEAL